MPTGAKISCLQELAKPLARHSFHHDRQQRISGVAVSVLQPRLREEIFLLQERRDQALLVKSRVINAQIAIVGNAGSVV